MTSPTLCRKIISRRAQELAADALTSKSEGLAWAVRSALGFWESNAADLNAKVLTRYYAILQTSIAEQVASPNPAFDLKEVQRHTESGHGLLTLRQPGADFPNGYYVASVMSGHFYSYSKYKGIDVKSYAFQKRPYKLEDVPDSERHRLVSLTDLFRRIPELRPMIEECFDLQPLSFHIGYDTHKNSHATISKEPSSDQTTVIAIYPDGQHLSVDYLNSFALPIKDIAAEHDTFTNFNYFVGRFTHPPGYWWQHLKTYKSGYCGTSIIAPLWGAISDPFVIHFITLYALSIVVRYLPSLWHDIEDGPLDHIRALIENYMAIVDNVLPLLSLERITGTSVHVVHPGSMNAPV